MEKDTQIEHFFDAYAARAQQALDGHDPDIEQVTAAFADCFVESGPVGVSCGKNDAQFREAIPKGYAYYRQAGITAMDIRAQHVELLDELHAMNRVQWNSAFRRKDGTAGSINFEVIYLLRLEQNDWKIFAYITGDEEQAMRDNGLID